MPNVPSQGSFAPLLTEVILVTPENAPAEPDDDLVDLLIALEMQQIDEREFDATISNWSEARRQTAVESRQALGLYEQVVSQPIAATVADTLNFDRCLGKWGDLELYHTLARSQMATVYFGRQNNLQRDVAVKVLMRSDSTSEDRFSQEAKILGQCSNDHLVPVYDVTRINNQFAFIMQYCVNGSLQTHKSAYIAGGPNAVVPLMLQVADGLSFAHQHGIVHRDLKPSNILLGDRMKPMVADFGLSKVVGPEDEPVGANLELTSHGQIMGTVPYMAPEQFAGNPDKITIRTDVWALGVMLYELLVGHRPFDSKDIDVITWQVNNQYYIDNLVKNASRLGRFRSVVHRALQVDPQRRFADAADFRAAVSKAYANTALQKFVRVAGLLLVAALLSAIFVHASGTWSPTPSVVTRAASEEEEKQAIKGLELADRLVRGETIDVLAEAKTEDCWRSVYATVPLSVRRTPDGIQFGSSEPTIIEILPTLPQRGIIAEVELRTDVQLRPFFTEGMVFVNGLFYGDEKECFFVSEVVGVVENDRRDPEIELSFLVSSFLVTLRDRHLRTCGWLNPTGNNPITFLPRNEDRSVPFTITTDPTKTSVDCSQIPFVEFASNARESFVQSRTRQTPVVGEITKSNVPRPVGLGVWLRGSTITIKKLIVRPL